MLFSQKRRNGCEEDAVDDKLYKVYLATFREQ